MSWLSSLVHDVGHGLSGVGHAVGSVLSNPIVDAGLTFIPGVGPVAAGLAGAAGGLLKPGGNLGSALTGGLEGGLAGSGAQSVAGMLGLGGAAGAGTAGLAGASGAVPSAAGASAGGVGGLISKLGGSGGWDLNKILQAASGAEGVYNTLEANKFRNQALDLAKGQNAAAAPLRAAAQSKLLNSQPPDLSNVYQNPQNPFSSIYRSVQ